jgi:hypothetical protein
MARIALYFIARGLVQFQKLPENWLTNLFTVLQIPDAAAAFFVITGEIVSPNRKRGQDGFNYKTSLNPVGK